MIRKTLIASLLIISLTGLKAQYISEVIEYRPAPGQFINSLPWGCPVSAYSLEGGISGALSLGSFGGYVVFRFGEPVENHADNPFGIDFSIFGNPSAEWAEPGVVWVMKDQNENGLPDDTWYELAGSDYYFSSTRKEYRVNYSNPGGQEAKDVPWSDQEGNSGAIRANSAHTQPYYPLADSFPDIPADAYILEGSAIPGAVDVDHPPLIKSLRRAFGYADMLVRGSGSHEVPDNPYTPELENSGGDAFDIDWAVDREGNPVELDQVHFVKVQTGILHEGGYLGEISTEITGAVDVSVDPELDGNLDLLVIRDLPAEIDTGRIQMELVLFHMGKPLTLPLIQWTASEDWATVDENQVLSVSGSGPLVLLAGVVGEAALQASVSTVVSPGITPITSSPARKVSAPILYPNPSRGKVHISGMDVSSLCFYDLTGKIVRQVENYSAGSAIQIQDLARGLYLVKIGEGPDVHWMKLLKE